MDVVVALNERLKRTPDGRVWSDSSFSYGILKRYLNVFNRVNVVARIAAEPEAHDQWCRVDGPHVRFSPVPYFVGPTAYLRNARAVHRTLRSVVDYGSAVVLRMPAWHTTGALATHLQRTGYPYAVEVCGDPHDRLARGACQHPLRPLFQWWVPRRTRQVCGRAAAALYVTQQALQTGYPAAATAISVGCSDVALPDEAFATAPRNFTDDAAPYKLVFVGTLERLYKAPDVLIRAVAACRIPGRRVVLSLVGAGQLQGSLNDLAKSLGIEKNVRFLGQLQGGQQVRQQFADADLFVLPSHQEGLPRAMAEAMAQGLPCIGSTVGGIPELLASEDMVPPGDVNALAGKIAEVLIDPQRMRRMATRNWERAQEYHQRVLDARREAFYVAIRERTETFLAADTAAHEAHPATQWEKAA